ncbi:MAG TPA: hypothetical protein DD435_11555 [Cyanobacteria bacterium UBA8530]|nr:hypothetical protein [Cyanobacteria bacterium UBA8530]
MGTSDIGSTKPLVNRGYLSTKAKIEETAASNAAAEIEAIKDLKSGRANTQQIADRLGLSPAAVEHLKKVGDKFADSDGHLSDASEKQLKNRLAGDEQGRAFFLKRFIEGMFSKMLKNFGG